MSEQVIIIGAGCAGYTAAIYTARANLSPLLITGSQIGGQLTTTTEVENFPGFPDGIMGPDLMFLMQQQAEKFGTRFAYEDVKSVIRDEATGLFTVKTSGQNYEARSIIVATGASARYLGIPGEEGLIGHGLTACATCDGAFYRDVPVCVVGGGDSACEEAAFLTRFASRVYLIHRPRYPPGLQNHGGTHAGEREDFPGLEFHHRGLQDGRQGRTGSRDAEEPRHRGGNGTGRQMRVHGHRPHSEHLFPG